MSPGSEDVFATTSAIRSYRLPRSGTLQNLRVRHNSAGGNGSSVDYRVRINAVDTALTVSLATGAVGDASNLVTTVAVVAGDLIDLVAVKAVNIGGGDIDVMVSLELD